MSTIIFYWSAALYGLSCFSFRIVNYIIKGRHPLFQESNGVCGGIHVTYYTFTHGPMAWLIFITVIISDVLLANLLLTLSHVLPVATWLDLHGSGIYGIVWQCCRQDLLNQSHDQECIKTMTIDQDFKRL